MLKYIGMGLPILLLGSLLAAQDMPLSDVLIPDEGWRLISEGHQFTEGPATAPDGSVYFTDVPQGKLFRIDPAGKVHLFAEGVERVSGLMFGPDGRLYAAQISVKRIVAFNEKGVAELIADEAACNDLVVDKKGGVYYTDPKDKRVWYINPEGEKRIVDEGIERPNGLILWPDGSSLVVADSWSDRLWTFRVEENGDLSAKEPTYFVRTRREDGRSLADGLTVDRAGRLYAAADTGLHVYDTQMRLSGVIQKPQVGFLSNVAFGGENLQFIYATSGDKVYRRKLNVQGLPSLAPKE